MRWITVAALLAAGGCTHDVEFIAAATLRPASVTPLAQVQTAAASYCGALGLDTYFVAGIQNPDYADGLYRCLPPPPK